MLLSTIIPMGIINVSAATADQSSPAHLIRHFEDGVIGNSDSDTDYTAELVDGAGASEKALKVTTSGTGAPSFEFGYRPGYTYNRSTTYNSNGEQVYVEDSETGEQKLKTFTETVTVERKYEFSAWIKVDSVPTSDTVELVYTFENPEKDSYKNMSPATMSKTIATLSNAGMKAGEWVKVTGEFVTDQSETVTANFTYTKTYNYILGSYDRTANGTNTFTIPEKGIVKAVVGGGMSYTIDDFVIMTKGSVYSYSNTPDSDTSVTRESDRFYKPQHQTYGGVGNGLGLYSFKGETSISTTANSNGWWVAHGSATLNKANGETIEGVPNESLVNNYVTITSTANEGQLVCNDIDYRHGVAYSVYVWAKAENETALKARLQAVVDVNADKRTDKENITANFYTAYATSILPAEENQSIYLTSEWRRYHFVFKYTNATYDEEFPEFCLKITNNGQKNEDGTGVSLAGAQYSLGNIKFYQQTGTEDSCLNATGHMKTYMIGDESYSVELDSHVDSGNITNCITRVMVPFNGDYVITKMFDGWKNNEIFDISAEDMTSIKMSVIPRDRSNHYGAEFVTFARGLNDYTSTAVAEFDQTVWAADMPYLSATVRYNMPSGDETMKAFCSMYNADGKMVSNDVQTLTLEKGEGKVSLSMPTTADAVKARVFLWIEEGFAPQRDDIPEITKTTNANFVYVDPVRGTDNTTYGYANPVPTMDKVISALNELKTSGGGKDIYIILMPGLHKVESTLKITAANTKANYNVVFTSYNKNDKGIISGGENLTGKFELYENGIYRAPVAVGTKSRQLYVDGVKGVRARSEGRLSGFTNTNVYRDDGYLGTLGAITSTDTSYKDFKNVDDLEFIFYSLWTMGRCGVTSITDNGDGTITFNMDSPGFKNISSKGNTRSRTPAWIENAYELIDQGGEWYLDEEGDGTNGYLYYLPREGEDMSTVEVILPTFDNYFMEDGPMIKIAGSSSSSMPARNVTFDGVEFSHTTWTRPSTEYGHSDAQNNHIRESIQTDAPTGDRLADGAIDVTYADNINFLNCDFTRMGITALRLLDGADNCNITGNEFFYISGSAVNIGDIATGRYTTEVGSAVPAADEPKILDNINFTNNYIHHVAHDYWSAAAISAGSPRNSTIIHNEICNIPYSGMHIGYGWSTTKWSTMQIKIENNYIHDLFQGDIYDGAGIYTIGGTGGTLENPCTLRGNFVENIGPGAATLYNDQGSTFWLVENNVSDISDAWGEYDPTGSGYKGASNCMNINLDNNGVSHNVIWRNNYSSVDDVYWSTGVKNDESSLLERPYGIDLSTGTWSAEAQAIIDNAGIEPEYRKNFEYGLQALVTPESVTMSAGESRANRPNIITGKDTLYKSNALVIEVVSSNESVATATVDTITAVSAGTAVITYTIKEGDIIRSVSTTVTVE